AIEAVSRHKLFEGILNRFGWNLDPLGPEFIAGEKECGSLDREQQHGEASALRLSQLAGDAVLVMSADHPVRPALIGNRVEVSIHRRLERMRIPGAVQKCKVQRQMHSRSIVAVKMTDAVGLALNLAAQHAIR